MSHELDMLRKNVAIATRVLLAQRLAAAEERRPAQEKDQGETDLPNRQDQQSRSKSSVSDA